jgi:branched-chain amino acid transport system ATP-binding protein
MAAATGEREKVVLETRGLTKHFGGVRAVDGVNLTIPCGDLRAIIGPNGAGKTTLFNLITGDLRRESGYISFRGEEISRLSPSEVCRRGIGRTFQITSVFRRLTAIENVQTALLSHHRRHYNLFADAARLYRDSALALLERVGLKEQAGKPGGILSHGDQRRLELAIALASEPRLLMLDEPTAGMAPSERHALMALVVHIAADTGLSVLFTEHDMDVVFTVARRITVMHQGCVLAEGTQQEIRLDPEVHRIYLGYAKAQ